MITCMSDRTNEHCSTELHGNADRPPHKDDDHLHHHHRFTMISPVKHVDKHPSSSPTPPIPTTIIMSSKPVYTLISATPSPYARKVRIVLAEKGIPFTLQTEVPWDSDTKTPTYNPLEKLPVLIHNETDQAVYESHFILEWLEVKHPDTVSMIPRDADQRLLAKQIEVVADGSFRFVSFRFVWNIALLVRLYP